MLVMRPPRRQKWRNQWLSAALQGGGAYVVGDRWAVEANGLEDARAMQAKIGGEVRS
jgi:hypothetical protein